MTPSPRGREEHRTLEVRKAELIASETTCCLPNLCPSHGEDEAAGGARRTQKVIIATRWKAEPRECGGERKSQNGREKL